MRGSRVLYVESGRTRSSTALQSFTAMRISGGRYGAATIPDGGQDDSEWPLHLPSTRCGVTRVVTNAHCDAAGLRWAARTAAAPQHSVMLAVYVLRWFGEQRRDEAATTVAMYTRHPWTTGCRWYIAIADASVPVVVMHNWCMDSRVLPSEHGLGLPQPAVLRAVDFSSRPTSAAECRSTARMTLYFPARLPHQML